MAKKKEIIEKFLIATGFFLVILIGLYFYFGGMSKKNVPPLKNFDADSILIFAHRGIPYYYPENSFESILNAKYLGFKALEIDLNETKDGQVVLFHDENCIWMLGLEGSISNFTLNELRNYPYVFNGKKTSNYVLTLDEVFKQFKNDFIIYLDLKNRSYSFTKKTIKLIKKYKLENSVILATPDFLLLARAEYNYPEINTCLEGFDSGDEWIYYLIPSHFKPDYFAGFVNSVDKSHIEWLEENDLLKNKVVYGVDVKNFYSTCKMGLKNIIINYDTTFSFYSSNKQKHLIN